VKAGAGARPATFELRNERCSQKGIIGAAESGVEHDSEVQLRANLKSRAGRIETGVSHAGPKRVFRAVMGDAFRKL
jgi:hypothetical protein